MKYYIALIILVFYCSSNVQSTKGIAEKPLSTKDCMHQYAATLLGGNPKKRNNKRAMALKNVIEKYIKARKGGNLKKVAKSLSSVLKNLKKNASPVAKKAIKSTDF